MPYTDGKNTWSGQYYATLTAPCGYYDLAAFTTFANVPPESELFALTPEQWAARMDGNTVLPKAVVNGVWVDYSPPIPTVPLTTQAATAQAWIQQQANLAAAMGEAFTADMKAYVKAVNAIASGADTASTALPAQPADVMVASAATS